MSGGRNITLEGENIMKRDLKICIGVEKEPEETTVLLVNMHVEPQWLHCTMKFRADVERIVVAEDDKDDFIDKGLDSVCHVGTRRPPTR